MASLKELLNEYAKTHQNPVNSAIHMVCVPVIVWASIGLGWGLSNMTYGRWLDWTIMPFINLGTIGIFLTLAYYWRLSKKLFASMVLFSLFTWTTLNALHFSGGLYTVFVVSLVLWVIAWAVQFYGHHVEGAKPAFADDLVFLLIGPAFVLDKIFKRFGSSLLTTT